MKTQENAKKRKKWRRIHVCLRTKRKKKAENEDAYSLKTMST